MNLEYAHILSGKDVDVAVTLSPDMQDAVLAAYDNGFARLQPHQRRALDQLIIRLKEQVWP